MGCWNATCGISGLPIHYLDPVVAMIIGRQNLGSFELTPSYPWDNFTPASLMVRGKYDDYGSVILNDEDLNILRRTQEESTHIMGNVTLPSGEVRYGGKTIPPFLAEFKRPEDEQKALMSQDEHDSETPFALWLAHQGVWDGMCERMTVHSYPAGRRPLKAWLAELVAENQSYGSDRMGLYKAREGWKRPMGMFQGPAVSYVCEALASDEPMHPAERAALVIHWMTLVSLYKIQDALRMPLWPTGAHGSQGQDLRARETLCSLTWDHIEQMRRRDYEDGDYDPEEAD